jgi:hypothetical protein
MRLRNLFALVLVFVLPLLAVGARAETGTILGSTLSTFAVFAGQTVTNTGPTTIVGDLGINPGSSYTGSGSVTQTGAVHIDDGTSLNALNDLITAKATLSGMPTTTDLTGTDLGGLVLAPGVYFFSSSAQLTGTLTLVNPSNLSNPTWVFNIGSTLTTASGSRVFLPAGSGEGVYWNVGSSATIGTGSAFEGNITALTSITMTTGATDTCGGLYAQNAAVTLDTNTISKGCAGTGGGGGGVPPGSAVPEPGTLALLSSGLLAMVFLTFCKSRVSSLRLSC